MLLTSNFWHKPRARHDVIHEGCGQWLPGFLIVDNQLAEHLPGALHHTAVHLAFDDGVIDHFAYVVHRAVRHDLWRASFLIDLDFGDVTAIGECRTEFPFGL